MSRSQTRKWNRCETEHRELFYREFCWAFEDCGLGNRVFAINRGKTVIWIGHDGFFHVMKLSTYSGPWPINQKDTADDLWVKRIHLDHYPDMHLNVIAAKVRCPVHYRNKVELSLTVAELGQYAKWLPSLIAVREGVAKKCKKPPTKLWNTPLSYVAKDDYIWTASARKIQKEKYESRV